MRKVLARWVLPVSRPPIEHGAVCISQGRIAWVGPAAAAPPAETIDLGDAALLPGLVNTHTHLELTAMRGWLEDLPFRRWVLRLTKGREHALCREDLLAAARVGVAEGFLAGITTFADTCASGVAHHALRGTGARGIVYVEVFGPDPAQCEASLAGLRATVAALRAADTSLVRTGVSPHAPYSVSDRLFAATASYARDEGLPMAIHVAESEAEARLVREADGEFADALRARHLPVAVRAPSPIALLERTGALAPRPLLIHCVRVSPSDLAAMRAHDCAVAHCPASNAKLGHGVAPLVEMLEAGLRVGLGTDSVASNNRMDLLDEARLAVLAQRARLGRHDAVGAAAALDLATLGGARALGLDGEIGSIEVGKAADLAAFPLAEPRAHPVHDVAAALVFAASGRGATFCCVAGEIVVRDGRLTFDLSPDLERVRASARSLQAFAAGGAGPAGPAPADRWPVPHGSGILQHPDSEI